MSRKFDCPQFTQVTYLMLRSDLFNRCNDNSVLIETVLATLNTGWKDESPRVRAVCVRGAAHVVALRGDLRAHVLPRALHALSQGIDANAAQ